MRCSSCFFSFSGGCGCCCCCLFRSGRRQRPLWRRRGPGSRFVSGRGFPWRSCFRATRFRPIVWLRRRQPILLWWWGCLWTSTRLSGRRTIVPRGWLRRTVAGRGLIRLRPILRCRLIVWLIRPLALIRRRRCSRPICRLICRTVRRLSTTSYSRGCGFHWGRLLHIRLRCRSARGAQALHLLACQRLIAGCFRLPPWSCVGR